MASDARPDRCLRRVGGQRTPRRSHTTSNVGRPAINADPRDPIEWSLSTAARIRLQRRMPKAIYKEEISQLVVPFPRDADQTVFLTDLLTELVPVPVASG